VLKQIMATKKAASTPKGKHIGFAKLKGELAHRKGVTNPGALAASIGRNKFGVAGMTKKSVAGRKAGSGKKK
jgi:hypothetical protein